MKNDIMFKSFIKCSYHVNPLVPEDINIYRIAKISFFKKRRDQGKNFL